MLRVLKDNYFLSITILVYVLIISFLFLNCSHTYFHNKAVEQFDLIRSRNVVENPYELDEFGYLKED